MHLTATNIILRTAVERWLAVGYKRFDFDFKRIRASRRNVSYVELQALSTFTCSCKLRTHTLPSDALQRSGPGAKAGGHGQPEARALTRHAPHAACLDHTGAAEKTFWEERTPVASLRSKARGANTVQLSLMPTLRGAGTHQATIIQANIIMTIIFSFAAHGWSQLRWTHQVGK